VSIRKPSHRVTLRSDAIQIPADNQQAASLQAAWLERFPASAVTFELTDFAFWQIVPRDARFVAGLGRTYNLSASDFSRAAQENL
jgi:hypothetical protein